jgi:peptidyl-Lys metalloendopeptidase
MTWLSQRCCLAALALLGLWLDAGTAVARGPAAAAANCDAKQMILIRHAFTVAERRTAAAVAFLDASPYHPHVREWFGTTPPPKIRVRLARTLELLRPERRPPHLCGTAEACGNRPVFAIANLVRRTVMLCPLFFQARNEGADSRPGVIVHEMTHLAAGTGDMAYGRSAALALARKEPDRAALNADNYEYFVEFLPDRVAARPAPR